MKFCAIYIHIPFCVKKCHYCDFVSFAGVTPAMMEVYIDAVKKELQLYGEEHKVKEPLTSVYVGGGTPSALPVVQLTGLLHEVYRIFPLQDGAEVTVECNPGAVDELYFSQLHQAGVNRISLGAQAFQEPLLIQMGRVHRVHDIYLAVEKARAAGINNINLDLMYGLPGQTLEDWYQSLVEAMRLAVPHVAAYGLKVEPQTPWGEIYPNWGENERNQDISADMLEQARIYLKKHGYIQYEISNFARPGFFSHHNRVYWKNENYLGVGAAAVSQFNQMRQTNLDDLTAYVDVVNRHCFPIADQEFIDLETNMAETIFLGLRMREGVNLANFNQRYGLSLTEKYRQKINMLVNKGLVQLDEHYLRLTEQGVFLANEVFMEFLPEG